MQRSKNDVWVGLFAMLGLVAVLFLALKSANLLQLNWSADYKIVPSSTTSEASNRAPP
jgi:phospholipid/cholesterol/gamma-HCH transport system substrate-binding protein